MDLPSVSAPKLSARHPRIVVNAAALTNLAYTGINVIQDVAINHRFTDTDKVFVASFIVGLICLLVPLAGVEIDNGETNTDPVVIEPGDTQPVSPATAQKVQP